MWKEYGKEKPTEEEHQYLVKEIVNNGTMEDLTFFHTCGYSKNLSKLDNFDFHGKTSGGFYDIAKENIVNVRIIDNNHATVIFDIKGSKFDGSSFDGTEWRWY